MATDIANINKDVFNSLVSPDLDRDLTFTSMEEAMAASGFTESETAIVSPFHVIRDKEELVGKPFFITSARISEDQLTERPFVVLYAITKEGEQVIITDGSTGIFQDIVTEVARRVDAGRERPMEGFYIPNGLRSSEYGLAMDPDTKQLRPARKGEKVVEKATTYYLL